MKHLIAKWSIFACFGLGDERIYLEFQSFTMFFYVYTLLLRCITFYYFLLRFFTFELIWLLNKTTMKHLIDKWSFFASFGLGDERMYLKFQSFTTFYYVFLRLHPFTTLYYVLLLFTTFSTFELIWLLIKTTMKHLIDKWSFFASFGLGDERMYLKFQSFTTFYYVFLRLHPFTTLYYVLLLFTAFFYVWVILITKQNYTMKHLITKWSIFASFCLEDERIYLKFQSFASFG